jgi:Arc/MetJ-type ribon-helix-helix transcriptional regulator
MELMLTPEMERTIQREIELGDFSSPTEVVATALIRLREERDFVTMKRAELDAKLEESFAAAARGETISAEEFEAEMDRWRASIQ